jgi:hypothetical protein
MTLELGHAYDGWFAWMVQERGLTEHAEEEARKVAAQNAGAR